MIALDTNVLVRYLVHDDPDQGERAATLIESAQEPLFVSHVVACEVVWVLQAVYGARKDRIVQVVKQLLRAKQLEFEAVELLHQAMAGYEKGRGDFADYVIAAQARGHGRDQVATFDKALLKEAGFVGA